MAVEWTAGEVDPDRNATEPPSPGAWRPVTVPGRPAAFAGADAVAYRTTFGDPRANDDDRVVLSLSGLYARARIWVDGERVATSDAYFAPTAVEIDPSGETELIVECLAPSDRFGGVHATDLVPDQQTVPGIWWDATLLIRPHTHLDDLSVSPRLNDPDGDAAIDVAVTVDAGAAVDDSITLSLRPEGHRGRGSMARVPVAADSGERTTVTETLEVRDPELWWPRGYGDQARYRVRATLGDDEATRVTGLRTVDFDGDDLLVNGRSIAARGFDLLPGDAYGEDLDAAASANATLVRPYGHVPPPGVHEACDRLGLLVWNDLPLVGPGSFDVDRARELAGTLLDERGRHPSLAVHTVHTAPIPAGSPLGNGRLARWRLRWRAWRADVDHDAPERVAEAYPDDAVVLPVAGRLGSDPDAAELFPGWEHGDASDVGWLLDRYPDLGRAVGAFGAGALADDGIDPGEGFDRRAHDAQVESDDPGASQAHQARTLKTVAEALRRRDCPIAAGFALRDPRPGGGMGVLAADGSEKRGYDAVAASMAPVQAILAAPPGRADGAVVCNDGPEPVEGTLRWTTDEGEGEAEVEVPAGGRTAVEAVDVPDGADGLTLELALSDRTVVNEYDL